jgi:hypothetical protein
MKEDEKLMKAAQAVPPTKANVSQPRQNKCSATFSTFSKQTFRNLVIIDDPQSRHSK